MPTDAGSVTAAVAISGDGGVGEFFTITAVADITGSGLPGQIEDAGTVVASHGTVSLETSQQSVTNPTQALIWPVTTITGPVTDPYLRNATTGQVLQWSGFDIPDSSVAVIDHYHRTVYLDGEEVPHCYPFVNNWWALVPGGNTIEVGAAFLTAGNISIGVAALPWRSGL